MYIYMLGKEKIFLEKVGNNQVCEDLCCTIFPMTST